MKSMMETKEDHATSKQMIGKNDHDRRFDHS